MLKKIKEWFKPKGGIVPEFEPRKNMKKGVNMNVMYEIDGHNVNLLMIATVTKIYEERFVHKDNGVVDDIGGIKKFYFNILYSNQTQFSVTTNKDRDWLEAEREKLLKAISKAWIMQNKTNSKSLAEHTYKMEVKDGTRRSKTKKNSKPKPRA